MEYEWALSEDNAQWRSVEPHRIRALTERGAECPVNQGKRQSDAIIAGDRLRRHYWRLGLMGGEAACFQSVRRGPERARHQLLSA